MFFKRMTCLDPCTWPARKSTVMNYWMELFLSYKKSGAYQKGQGLDRAFAQSIPIHNLVEWSWADLNCGITGMCCLCSATVECQVTGTGNWGLRAAVRKYRLGCAT